MHGKVPAFSAKRARLELLHSHVEKIVGKRANQKSFDFCYVLWIHFVSANISRQIVQPSWHSFDSSMLFVCSTKFNVVYVRMINQKYLPRITVTKVPFECILRLQPKVSFLCLPYI